MDVNTKKLPIVIQVLWMGLSGFTIGICFWLFLLVLIGWILPEANADEVVATREARLGEQDRTIQGHRGPTLEEYVLYDQPLMFIPGVNSFCSENVAADTRIYIAKLTAMDDYEPVFPQFSRIERIAMAQSNLGTIERCVKKLREGDEL